MDLQKVLEMECSVCKARTKRTYNELVNAVTIPAGTLFSETYSNNSWGLNRNVTLQKKGDADVEIMVVVGP